MQEKINKIETNGNTVDEIVHSIIKDTTVELDNYINLVRNTFLSSNDILDDDLDRIVLRIPVYLYPLIVLAQQIEIRKGLAKEQASYEKNDILLTATGTVQQKEAFALNQTAKDRMIQIAYATASSVISDKIDGAMAILDSAKKVQQRRMKEKVLTNQAGNAVGAF